MKPVAAFLRGTSLRVLTGTRRAIGMLHPVRTPRPIKAAGATDGLATRSLTAAPPCSYWAQRGFDRRRLYSRGRLLCTGARAGVGIALAVWAASAGLAQSVPLRDISEFSLEDLMNVQVTSVSKKEQKLSKTGAAIYVITQEDIRRSGATGIPDLLRMVPGVSVAQVNANRWAIGVRGFNSVYANKVLVLIDGRSVYSPSFSGVFWEEQDMPLEDIDRIEVIRGPGGTVWGANAMNGVINIITKSSKATQGGLVSAGGGSQELARGLVRYGGAIGQKGTYRVFGNYSDFRSMPTPSGGDASDGWHKSHAGFRTDWELSPSDTLTIEGDLLQSRARQTLTTLISADQFREATLVDKMNAETGDLLGRWNHVFSNGSDMSLQMYYDYSHLIYLGADDTRQTVDFDFHHHLKIGSRHDIVWGLGYRVTTDNLGSGYSTRFSPARRTDGLYSTFAQDEIRLTNSLWLTIGSKFEHNAYTGFEYEPGAQIVWAMQPRHTVWASASRAIRQPARVDSGLELDISKIPIGGGAFGIAQFVGGRARQSERVRAYQGGYRTQISKKLSLDIAAFSSDYRNLQTIEPATPYFELQKPPPHLVFPAALGNQGSGHTYGAELFATWNLHHRWRLSPGYSWIRMNFAVDPGSQDTVLVLTPNSTPRHQYQVRSSFSLTRRLDWDCSIAYTGRLGGSEATAIPGYARADTRLGWRIGESLELSVTGQNLLSPRHSEFGDSAGVGVPHAAMARSVFGKATWRF